MGDPVSWHFITRV